MENLIPYEGFFRCEDAAHVQDAETRRCAINLLGAFGEREGTCVVESEILKAGNDLMDFQLIVWTLVGIVGAADQQQRRTYRKLKSPFFLVRAISPDKGTVNLISV